VIDALAEVAPELDPAALDPEAPIRDQLDVDSLDFLDFVAALSEIHGTDIPESDYAELSTVDSCAAYLAKTPSA
jgi:acyl carrier protein